MKQKLSSYNGVPEGLPTPEEMWAKLTGTDKEFTLEDFQRAVERLIDDEII